MKGYSLTSFGILIAVGVPLLVQLGFSEVCANEVFTVVPASIGGIIAWIGRYRQGGINVFGFRK